MAGNARRRIAAGRACEGAVGVRSEERGKRKEERGKRKEIGWETVGSGELVGRGPTGVDRVQRKTENKREVR